MSRKLSSKGKGDIKTLNQTKSEGIHYKQTRPARNAKRSYSGRKKMTCQDQHKEKKCQKINE